MLRNVYKSHAMYLGHAYSDADEIINLAEATIAGRRYDTLVGTGLSGSLVVPLLARHFSKHWAIVRKPNDGAHSSRSVEGSIGKRWVFVDDLIDSGTTFQRVLSAVEATGHATKHVGSYLYDGFYGPEFRKP